MPVLAAMLRGINLGSHNRLAMADLMRAVASLGGEHVRTYVQSGNVVFDGPLADRPDPGGEISAAIAAAHGLSVVVLTRTGAELARVAADPHFPRADLIRIYVTFLAEPPAAAGRGGAIDPARFAPDEFTVDGREVYLHCPNGYGNSKLSNGFYEKQFGVAATTRNWRTVTALAALTAPAGAAG